MGQKGHSKYNHIEGTRIGYYIVKKVLNGKALVQCDCGTERLLDLWYAATSGRKCTECGNRQLGIENGYFKGYKGLYGNWIHKLNTRNKRLGYDPCDFDIKYLWELYLQQNKKCALTGLHIEMKLKDATTHRGYRQIASLDRIDSNLGYKIGNVQWVHKDVNIMKNKFDLDYFLKMCTLITNNNEVKQEN
jgi:hypothetical protein